MMLTLLTKRVELQLPRCPLSWKTCWRNIISHSADKTLTNTIGNTATIQHDLNSTIEVFINQRTLLENEYGYMMEGLSGSLYHSCFS